MKTRGFICLILAFMMFALAGCGVTDTDGAGDTESDDITDEATVEDTEGDTEKNTGTENKEVKEPCRILFIGNSYTYYCDMPNSIFRLMAKVEGQNLEVTALTQGGYKLSQFADPTNEFGAKVEKELTGAKKYDYVILQEQSVRPAADPEAFYTAVRNLVKRIKVTGATPVLYSTWGRKTGSSTLDTYGWTNESMTWKLAASYAAIGEELDIPVVHVGLAFYDVYTNHSEIELYNEDKSHPSYMGSYLAAVCLYSEIFDEDPTEISFAGSTSSADAKILRQAAKDALYNTPSIPDKYKTSSVGIGS